MGESTVNAGSCVLSAAAVLVVGQVVYFLYSGEWVAVTALEFITTVTGVFRSYPSWLYAPESWLGLHKLLAAAPASLTLAAFGLLLIALGLVLDGFN